MISIICPTIKGREYWLEKCRVSYEATTDVEYEFLVYNDYPNCDLAWNAGIPEASFDTIHLTADDIEAHEGWVEAGISALARNFLPCPRILNPDGTLQSCGSTDQEAPDGTPSNVARIPLFKKEWVKYFYPFPDMQYMGDVWLTDRCNTVGIPTLVVRDYLFTHGFAMEGRLYTYEEDIKKYRKEYSL